MATRPMHFRKSHDSLPAMTDRGAKQRRRVGLHLCPGRGGQHAERILQGFGGIPQVDGYAGNNRLIESTRTGPAPIAEDGVALIRDLHAIEAEIRGSDPAARLAIRQNRSAPIVARTDDRLAPPLGPARRDRQDFQPGFAFAPKQCIAARGCCPTVPLCWRFWPRSVCWPRSDPGSGPCRFGWVTIPFVSTVRFDRLEPRVQRGPTLVFRASCSQQPDLRPANTAAKPNIGAGSRFVLVPILQRPGLNR